MDNDYLELEFLSLLLSQGYAMQDIVKLLKISFHSKEIILFEEGLKEGLSIENAIMNAYKESFFKEYFCFFLKKNSISKAINLTLETCKKQKQIMNQLRKQLLYPVFLLVFLFFFSIFVSWFLLPQVRIMIEDFGSSLSFVQEFMFVMFQVIPLVVFIFLGYLIGWVIYLIYCVKKKWSYRLLILLDKKIISSLLKKYYSFKFSFYYNELLKTGYDTTASIEFLYEHLKNHDLQVVLYPIMKQFESGVSLEQCIASSPYLDQLLVQYIYMMQKKIDDKSLDDYIELSSKMMETKINKVLFYIIPSIYCFVALFVVFVYLSVIFPLMNVIEGI
ncbi:type II secretion system F family protein [Tannockella kyphosi]|uniref:type II secretion system F family protein n=1 Tax=Tannockella kyphosi TaxID=2899121 RepID=UPI002011C2E5|nr:type II secretion system F family protein [Tannockella kyphosi]